MNKTKQQLEALHELRRVYVVIMNDGKPCRIELPADTEVLLDANFNTIVDRLAGHAELAREAQTRLLKTGFDPPDHWLSVRTSGQLQCAGRCKDTGEDVWEYTGADTDQLEKIFWEIHAAILRLDAAGDDQPAEDQIPAAQGKSTKEPTAEERALSALIEWPDRPWTTRAMAKHIGRNERTLQRDRAPRFAQALDIYQQGSLPRGQIDRNGNLEAWDND